MPISEPATLSLYIAVAYIVGAAFGLTELSGRHIWGIRNVILSVPGLIYLSINGGLAIAAYLVMVEWNIYLGLEGKSEYFRVIVASIAAMALIRSSFSAKMKIGDKDVGAAFVSFVEFFLKRAELSLEQKLFEKQLDTVVPLLGNLKYDDCKDQISALAQTVLKSLSTNDVERLNADLALIDKLELRASVKLELLAARMAMLTGIRLLRRIVEMASREIPVTAEENGLARRSFEAKLRELNSLRELLHAEPKSPTDR